MSHKRQPDAQLSDDVLRQYVREGFDQPTIASLCGLSQQAISYRIKKLQEKDAAFGQVAVNRSMVDMFSTVEAARESYNRTLALYEESSENPNASFSDKVRVNEQLLKHVAFAAGVLEKMYGIQRQKEFQDAVVAEMEHLAPGIKAKIARRIDALRSLRSATQPV